MWRPIVLSSNDFQENGFISQTNNLIIIHTLFKIVFVCWVRWEVRKLLINRESAKTGNREPQIAYSKAFMPPRNCLKPNIDRYRVHLLFNFPPMAQKAFRSFDGHYYSLRTYMKTHIYFSLRSKDNSFWGNAIFCKYNLRFFLFFQKDVSSLWFSFSSAPSNSPFLSMNGK